MSRKSLNERWKTPPKSTLPVVDVKGRKYHYEVCNESSPFSFIIHGKNGARYGLVGKPTSSSYLPLNMKNKKIAKKLGKFKFTESGLTWLGVSDTMVESHKVLLEGGVAATNLIPQLIENGAPEGIEFSKIPAKEMGAVFQEIVRPLLSNLSGAGFLDPEYKSEFGLGSTRLAAYSSGEQVKLLPSENDDVIANALKSKTTYGDLDIDVVLNDGVSMKEVGQYLQNQDPSRIAFRPAGGEINIAYVWDDERVIQVDLVDMSGEHKEKMEFRQSSSFVDMAQGVKGVFQTNLLSAVLAVKDLTPEEQEQIHSAMASHPEIAKWLNQGYDFQIEGIDNNKTGRWQMSNDGVVLVIDLYKKGRKEGSITRKPIKLTDSMQGFSDMDKLLNAIIPNVTLDTVSSAVRLAQTFKGKYPNKTEELWQKFLSGMKNAKRGLDASDYTNGMSVIADILGQEFNPEEEA